MEEEQYLTEKHYLVCDKGFAPKQMKVTSQDFVTFSGDKAATELDTMKGNNFICLGSVAFMAGAAVGIAMAVCAMIPGPGWLVAAVIAAIILAAVAVGVIKCKVAAAQRVWTKTSQKFSIQDHKTLTLSSVMVCPAEGGTITAKETIWEALGSAALANLGHALNFAFGFLVGRGMAAMAGEGAIAAAAAEGGGMAAARAGGQAVLQSFGNAARKELIEQFTFKGFKNLPAACKWLRGLGIGGAYYDQYNIWSSDKEVLDKLKESGISLVLGIFAAHGATKSCFPAGTKVHTPDGLKNIEELKEGELVLTYNEITKQQEYKVILVRHERFTQQMLTIELPTGEFIRVTPEHRFFCNDEWIQAGNLKAGDLLHLKGGNYTTVISIEILPHYEKVYNFDIADNENYYVTEDGILVHNGYQKGRLPKTNGEWVEGTPGNGLWKSNKPEVNAITNNEPIPFSNGRPDFSKWKVGDDLKVDGMTGADSDFPKIYDKLKQEYGFRTQKEVKEWLSQQGLTPHHLDDKTVQLIPTDLHGNIPHKGSASDMRELNGI